MRVLIMSNMEGVSSVVVWEQVKVGAPMYEEARRLYTEEINAAVRGAKAAGAEEIIVVDCHDAGEPYSFNSLIPELLEPDCEWVAHHPWCRYTRSLEQGCEAVLLVGMHARAGTPSAVLSHTVSATDWRNVWFNDVLVGETGIYAALCGHFGAPVLLVTGDEAAIWEARALLGSGLATVAVKRGLSRYSARQVPPLRARQMIEAGARWALRDLKSVQPYRPEAPTTITVELSTVNQAAAFKGRPGLEIVDDLKVSSRAGDWLAAWNQIWSE